MVKKRNKREEKFFNKYYKKKNAPVKSAFYKVVLKVNLGSPKRDIRSQTL